MGGSLIRRRQLARRLRALREAAGLSLEEAAPKLDWSTSKLSRIEMAQQQVDVHWVRSMLDLYGIGGTQWTELVDLARAAQRRGWWKDFGLTDRGYVPLEAESKLVRTFQTMVVPGLLQTPEYTRTLFRTAVAGHSDETIENAVRVRAIRQARLTAEDDALELVAVVDEGALRRPVGGRAVMSAQLAHLLIMAELPTVTLQVLPTAVGAHVGFDGPFSILGFGDLGEPDILYIEHQNGAAHIEKAAEVERATIVFDRLRSEALGPADSLPLIERVVDRMGG